MNFWTNECEGSKDIIILCISSHISFLISSLMMFDFKPLVLPNTLIFLLSMQFISHMDESYNNFLHVMILACIKIYEIWYSRRNILFYKYQIRIIHFQHYLKMYYGLPKKSNLSFFVLSYCKNMTTRFSDIKR